MLVVRDYITVSYNAVIAVWNGELLYGWVCSQLGTAGAADAVSSLQMAMSHCLLFSSASCAVAMTDASTNFHFASVSGNSFPLLGELSQHVCHHKFTLVQLSASHFHTLG